MKRSSTLLSFFLLFMLSIDCLEADRWWEKFVPRRQREAQPGVQLSSAESAALLQKLREIAQYLPFDDDISVESSRMKSAIEAIDEAEFVGFENKNEYSAAVHHLESLLNKKLDTVWAHPNPKLREVHFYVASLKSLGLITDRRQELSHFEILKQLINVYQRLYQGLAQGKTTYHYSLKTLKIKMEQLAQTQPIPEPGIMVKVNSLLASTKDWEEIISDLGTIERLTRLPVSEGVRFLEKMQLAYRMHMHEHNVQFFVRVLDHFALLLKREMLFLWQSETPNTEVVNKYLNIVQALLTIHRAELLYNISWLSGTFLRLMTSYQSFVRSMLENMPDKETRYKELVKVRKQLDEVLNRIPAALASEFGRPTIETVYQAIFEQAEQLFHPTIDAKLLRKIKELADATDTSIKALKEYVKTLEKAKEATEKHTITFSIYMDAFNAVKKLFKSRLLERWNYQGMWAFDDAFLSELKTFADEAITLNIIRPDEEVQNYLALSQVLFRLLKGYQRLNHEMSGTDWYRQREAFNDVQSMHSYLQDLFTSNNSLYREFGQPQVIHDYAYIFAKAEGLFETPPPEQPEPSQQLPPKSKAPAGSEWAKKYATQKAKIDYYDILGIPRTATLREIKKAYRRLSVKFHPDKNPEYEDEAGELFKDISEAFEILSNEQVRKVYDKYGKKAAQAKLRRLQ